MNWAVWVVFGIAAGVLVISAALAGRSPQFWAGIAKIAIDAAWPALKAYFLKQMSEEKTTAWINFQRRNPNGRRIDFERMWECGQIK